MIQENHGQFWFSDQGKVTGGMGDVFSGGGGMGWYVCVSKDSFQRKLGVFCLFAIVQGHVINTQVPPTVVGASVH